MNLMILSMTDTDETTSTIDSSTNKNKFPHLPKQIAANEEHNFQSTTLNSNDCSKPNKSKSITFQPAIISKRPLPTSSS